MKVSIVVLSMLSIVAMADADLLLHYTFDGSMSDSTGTYDGDAKGTAGDGSYVEPSLGYTTGKFGLAADLSGDDWIWVNGGNPLSQLTNQVTIAYWTKMDSVQNQVEMVAGMDSTGNNRLAFAQYWYGTAYWDTTGGRASASIPAETSDGQWHHWAFTRNAGTGLQSIYFDGEVIGQSTNLFDPFADAFGGLAIGAHFEYGDTYVGGLDDFRIYDNELSQTGIQAIMVPEPATIALFGLSSLFMKRRKK
ncbi:MAG: LamG-like jellyroll fold domain-containing protein [Phycisphaerae bacterium]